MARTVYFDISKEISTTGDLALSINEQAVMDSVINIITTEKNTKVFRKRDFGVNLLKYTFEFADRITAIDMYEDIVQGIEKYEYRAKNLDVKITPIPNDNEFLIDIYFNIEESENPIEIKTALSKIR